LDKNYFLEESDYLNGKLPDKTKLQISLSAVYRFTLRNYAAFSSNIALWTAGGAASHRLPLLGFRIRLTYS